MQTTLSLTYPQALALTEEVKTFPDVLILSRISPYSGHHAIVVSFLDASDLFELGRIVDVSVQRMEISEAHERGEL